MNNMSKVLKLHRLGLVMSSIMFSLLLSCSGSSVKGVNVNEDSKQYYDDLKAEKANKREKIKVNNPFVEKVVPEFQDPKKIAKGRRIYQSHCFQCHGKNAEGDGPVAKYLDNRPQNLIKAMKRVPDLEFFLNVSKWYGKMPGWERHLTNDEVRALAAYLNDLTQKKKN